MIGFVLAWIPQDPINPLHWAAYFWEHVRSTTVIGIPLTMLIHPRTWHSRCPIGTVQSAIGGRRNQLRIVTDPVRCTSTLAPYTFPSLNTKDAGVVDELDCLQCSEYVAICPVDAPALGNLASAELLEEHD